MQREPAVEIADAHREERRRQVAGEAGREIERRRRRSPDVHLEPGAVERVEEPETDDVIHVEMREQDVDALRLRRQRRAEAADPRAAVEDEDVIAGDAHLDAHRVAAVAHGLGSGRRE